MADSSFGLKIGLEGEREFKRAITDINREMRVLGSEMKLVASSFDKNDKSAESLTVRNQVLGKEIEAQKSKIETLRAALENSASSFGENDSRTKNWQIQLNNPSQAPYLWATSTTLARSRGAAYARVSADRGEQYSSYQAQVDYYATYIQGRPEWECRKYCTLTQGCC